MKFGVLFLALLAIFPLGLLLRSTPVLRKPFWIGFGALPFFAAAIPLFDVGLLSWAGRWVGFVYGLQISIVDILAASALFAMPRGKLPLWCKLPFLFYILAAALSLLQAAEPVAASFGVLQFARIFLVMVVVARASTSDPEVPLLMLKGMAIGIAAHFVAVLYQRFQLHLPQTMGLFIHQNTLGMAAHFVLFPHLALLLAGYRNVRYLVTTVVATIVVVVFTASRAAVGFSVIGLGTLFVTQALAGLTQRKMAVGFAALASLLIVAPLAISTFSNRFELNPLGESQYDERAAFNRAASFILDDHPLGVGINHYVHVARDLGYSERAGVIGFEGNRNNIVHNAYWLTAAEAGYPGVLAFCVMLIVPLFVAWRTGWRMRHTLEGNLLLGFGVTLLVVYLHSFYEWVIFAREIQYLLTMTMGMVFGIALRLRAPAAEGNPLPMKAMRLNAQ
ncbi:O-antigen ligase [Aminobacter lissarensis]|uniref:O-antigen ligase n=1 Tax=Aminobacter carboxidus TaxID=376165 RepID=A0A8E1WGJ0_9HYPH|nr:O-antigen ligase family protein [Aminobacter lissarensis]MBB6468480.1 O-antigen ligase [Aminobacter lissarensis]